MASQTSSISTRAMLQLWNLLPENAQSNILRLYAWSEFGAGKKWKNLIVVLALLQVAWKVVQILREYGIVGLASKIKNDAISLFFTQAKRIPLVRRRIDEKVAEIRQSLEKDLLTVSKKLPTVARLPDHGLNIADLERLIDQYDGLEATDWSSGVVSGVVYHGGEELLDVIAKTYRRFEVSNPLHPDVFPGVRKMEAEVISMVINMFNGTPGKHVGAMTSGGTESILMAVKAHRDYYRIHHGIKKPNIVMPVTAHAAFDKACHYFGVRPIHVDMDPISGKVDLDKMRAAITPNTIMLVGSAFNYPHGMIDDIETLSDMALEHNVGLHVDACLGGFIICFMEKAGFHVPVCDFRLPGVTSISCDTHKYGFAPKGSSVVLFRDAELRHQMYFVQPDWPGGLYATGIMSGSRPGALIAGCWSAMMSVGEAGYVEATRAIVNATRVLADGIRNIKEVQLIGDPIGSVIAFSSDTIDIYRITGSMVSRGWMIHTLQYPAAAHFTVTYLTVKATDKFISDLKEIVEECLENPTAPVSDSVAIYGLAASIPDRSLVSDITRVFLDVVYST